LKNNSITRRQWCKLGAATLTGISAPSLLFLSTPATAQAYPNRPIRMVSPWTPGGGTDLVGRNLATAMSQILGQSIIYENKPGAGTVIGSDFVAKAAPDGYTLLLTTSAHSINSTLIKNLPYNTEKSFADVALICKGPNILVTRPDSPYKTVKDVITAARANPGKLTYGSSGNGSSVHLTAELFKLTAKVDITHIPYKGAGPAYVDLMGGQIDLVFATAAGVGKFIDAGKMHGIAVTSATRSPVWPKIPTIAESGVPGFEADVWYALFATGGTPPDIVRQLNTAARAAVNTEEFKSRIEGEGLTVAIGSPQDLTRLIKLDEERWGKVVNQAKVTI